MKSRTLYNFVREAVVQVPAVKPLLSAKARFILSMKSEPIPREELERRLAKKIKAVDKKYLLILEASDGIVPVNYWIDYERELHTVIASTLRSQIEQSFMNYSDYIAFIDTNGAISDIDTAITRAIDGVAKGITANSRKRLQALILEGITGAELVERMAIRFSSGHAEQVAVTELTRAESFFADALSSRLTEQGVDNQIRWNTAEDEKVCPICAPADGKLRDERITTSKGGWNGQTWGERYGRPPAHPNCRCLTIVEITKRKPNV